MKFVRYMLFVLILIMCRSYAHEGETFVKNAFILIMVMSHACMSLYIMLAMLVFNMWLSCLSMSLFSM
jgi:hypothetical protein